MQKKSLLVALFCGALCLTGCLKNEESASVAQVRLAKAEELKSLAALNEATAAAKLIYANAEKTIKDAEAKLIEAQAALVNAQAETEKVRAELLKVQVQLANVLVEEEKVKLKMMEADLEARLAALEVEKAAADAAKQAWANVLNDLVAQAQIDAINNSKKILEAEENLADYVLTLEGQKADSAKYYAGLYFEALEKVEELQVEELKWKATQVLVNQGAILTRDAIHEMIKANNEEIAENNAIIAELKEHQTLTPEEAEAALKAARQELEEAYTKYQDALTAEASTKKLRDELVEDFTADFTQGWDSWVWDLKAKMPHSAFVQKYQKVEVGESTVIVPTVGINVKTDAGVEFVPFFNDEATAVVNGRYPNVTVYDKEETAFVHLQSTVIAPATIQYDNIEKALDKAIEKKEAAAEKNIARRAAANEWVAAQYENRIEELQEGMELHEAYVAARKDAVEEAEQAYIDALAAAAKAEEDEAAAWKEFQTYMMLTYPTLTSNLFIDRLDAQKAYDKAKSVEAQYAKKVQAVIDRDSVALKAAVKPLFEEYAAAIGDYREIIEAINSNKNFWEMNMQEFWQWWFTRQDIPSDAKAAYNAWKASMEVWSPEFADATETPECVEPGKWVKGEGEDAVYAGTSQAAVLDANFLLERAKELEYAAYIDFLSGAITEEAYAAAQQAVSDAEDALVAATTAQDEAWLDYVEKYNKISEILGIFVNEIEKYYNPEFEVFDWVVFPTDALYDPEKTVDFAVRDGALDTKGNWVFDAKDYEGAVPAIAQRELLNAVKAVVDFRKDLKKAKADLAPKTADAQSKLAALTSANNALIVALGGKAGEPISKYLDTEAEALYEAYLAATKVVVDVDKVYDALWEAYRPYPDFFGPATDHNHPYDEPKNFGWLISNYQLDYTATYLGEDGKKHSIAKLLNPESINPFAHSMQYKVEEAQFMIEEVLPAQLAAYEKAQNKIVKAFKAEAASILEKVNAYKPLETQYTTWVDLRNAADKAYNQAQMDTYDANLDYKVAKAVYKAIDAIANEYVWVYDAEEDDFVQIPVAKAIAYFEAKNEELEAENEFYRNVLTDGETVLATVNQILDEKIQTISDNIKILNAISAQYKAIMNAYLGIVEE